MELKVFVMGNSRESEIWRLYPDNKNMLYNIFGANVTANVCITIFMFYPKKSC